MSDSPLMDLRLADLEVCVAVFRAKSVSNVARQLGVTPSQVSKAVARVERHLNVQFLERTNGKIGPSPQGHRLVAELEHVLRLLRSIQGANEQSVKQLTIATPSYLQGKCLAVLARALPDVRVCGLELGPAPIRGSAPDGIFDVAVTTSGEGFGESWLVERIGDVRSGLFGSKALVESLGPMPISAERLENVPFISPKVPPNVIVSDDMCPIRVGERILGHEVQTFGSGLELAACSRQVVFGPFIAARSYIERGLVMPIDVSGWDVRMPLFLATNIDRVMASMRKLAFQGFADWLQSEG